jgi:hypothetical protein
MSHASGEGNSFVIRPVAMRPDDYKVVAERLTAIFKSAPKGIASPAAAPPAVDLTGRWDAEIQYQAGSASHKIFLNAKGNKVTGTHLGWAFEGAVRGSLNGDHVELRSALPAGGQRLTYTFSGRVAGDAMSGELYLGEYGVARWTARRHSQA